MDSAYLFEAIIHGTIATGLLIAFVYSCVVLCRFGRNAASAFALCAALFLLGNEIVGPLYSISLAFRLSFAQIRFLAAYLAVCTSLQPGQLCVPLLDTTQQKVCTEGLYFYAGREITHGFVIPLVGLILLSLVYQGTLSLEANRDKRLTKNRKHSALAREECRGKNHDDYSFGDYFSRIVRSSRFCAIC